MATVRLDHMTKKFGKNRVLKDISLGIADGGFTCLLGPSGAGKTTLLRTIAGLEKPDSGRLFFGDADITHFPLQKRDVAMVFQDFTLYPNLNVFENIASPLRARKENKEIIRKEVMEVAETLRIDLLLDRFPRQLSGGEMQRVSIARAMAKRPGVYLFDEILVNLDYKIREEMRTMLKDLARKLGSTVIYATPEPLDALSLAEKVVVLNHGEVIQEGETFDVYRRPVNTFVGRYFGYPEMNFMEGVLCSTSRGTAFEFEGMEAALGPLGAQFEGVAGNSVTLGIRPEDITVAETPGNRNEVTLEAELRICEIIGSDTILHLDHAGTLIKVFVPEIVNGHSGDRLRIHFGPDEMHFFSAADGRLICRG